jgi:hypothetical protein
MPGSRIASQTDFMVNDGFLETTMGPPSQGEGNVSRVARWFIDTANRSFGTDYYDLKPVSCSARDEAGYDCILCSRSGKNLRLQVTRALPPAVYRGQSQRGSREVKVKFDEAATWILSAIERKASKASPDVALVIDATDSPGLGFITDGIARRRICDDEPLGWHSIWVVGPFGLRHIGGGGFPGTGRSSE